MSASRGFTSRETGDGKVTVTGYATTWDTVYDFGGFKEKVLRGACKRSLNSQPPPQIIFNIAHGDGGSGLPMASTRNGDLTVTEDDTGLLLEAVLDTADPDVATIVPKLEKGRLGASWAFRVLKDSWDPDYAERTIESVNLDRGDVTACAYGANPAAYVSLRSADLTLEQRRGRAEKLEARWSGTLPILSARSTPTDDRAFDDWFAAREDVARLGAGLKPTGEDPLLAARAALAELADRAAEQDTAALTWAQTERRREENR